MPARDPDPIVKALHVFAARIGLPDEDCVRILQCIEGTRYARVRERYAERRAAGWKRVRTKAQKKVLAAQRRKQRADAKAAQRAQLQSLKKAA